MNNHEIFDPKGGHAQAWERLPDYLRQSFSAMQRTIQEEIDRKNPGKYRVVSGWRSDRGNRACGGIVDSDHLWALARDFRSVDGGNTPPRVCSKRFQVIRSGPDGKTYHVRIL